MNIFIKTLQMNFPVCVNCNQPCFEVCQYECGHKTCYNCAFLNNFLCQECLSDQTLLNTVLPAQKTELQLLKQNFNPADFQQFGLYYLSKNLNYLTQYNIECRICFQQFKTPREFEVHLLVHGLKSCQKCRQYHETCV